MNRKRGDVIDHLAMRVLGVTVIIFLPLTLGFLDEYSYSFQCKGKKGVEFLKSWDNVPGRYIVRVCKTANNYTKWDLDIYYENSTESECSLNKTSTRKRQKHSSASINLNYTCDHDASVVCLDKYFDLIFTGCYSMNSMLVIGNLGVPLRKTIHFVNSNTTREAYERNRYYTDVTISSSGTMQIIWSLGYIPISNYKLKICQTNNEICTYFQKHCRKEQVVDSNCKLPTEFKEESCLENIKNCTSIQDYCNKTGWYGINCRVPKVLAGDYVLLLEQDVLWSNLIFHSKIDSSSYYFFSIENKTEEVHLPNEGSIWFTLTCVLLSLAIAALSLSIPVMRKCRCANNSRKLYPDSNEVERLTHVSCQPNAPKLVVLYASDVMTEGRALFKLLKDNGLNDVVDIQSPAAAAQAAPACYEWIENVIKDDDCKVVILQSPAMLGDSKSCADDIVHCARRYITTVPNRNHYTKFYVARLPGATELLDLVAPLTRYEIPHLATNLLTDVLNLKPGTANFVGLEEFEKKVLSGDLEL